MGLTYAVVWEVHAVPKTARKNCFTFLSEYQVTMTFTDTLCSRTPVKIQGIRPLNTFYIAFSLGITRFTLV